jgi:hypothetical protein
MKHTPGPWTIDPGFPVLQTRIVEISGPTKMKSGCHLASVYTTTGEKDDPESIANARLIAAAPDLYDSLKEILETIILSGGSGEIYERFSKEVIKSAVYAIAKAEGNPLTEQDDDRR